MRERRDFLATGAGIAAGTLLAACATAPAAQKQSPGTVSGTEHWTHKRTALGDVRLFLMPGIAHTSLRSKNWRMVYDIVDACCSRAAPVYTG